MLVHHGRKNPATKIALVLLKRASPTLLADPVTKATCGQAARSQVPAPKASKTQTLYNGSTEDQASHVSNHHLFPAKDPRELTLINSWPDSNALRVLSMWGIEHNTAIAILRRHHCRSVDTLRIW